jgi:tripartite-type tricarboxylate transporter receptor subunit TctC
MLLTNVLVVHPSVPAKTVPEFIDYVKANPGKVYFASSGTGASPHMSAELFKVMTGINMVHVPYRGGAPTMQDLVAGNIQVAFGTLPSVLPHVANGSIRMIAAAEAKRLTDYPDLPTINETIPGVINIGWNGLLAPAGTPTPIIDKLNAVTVDALKKPDVMARMKLQGLTPISDTPAQFAKLISDEIAYWGKVIPAIGIKPE